MTPRLLAISGLIALAACGDGHVATQGNSAGARRIAIANPHHEQLAQLSAPNQRLAMMRAIRQTGHRCQRVENAGFQQDYENMKMWTASCLDDRQWAVFIAPNADVQVRNCAEAAQLRLPACTPLPPLAPGDSPDYFANTSRADPGNGQ